MKKKTLILKISQFVEVEVDENLSEQQEWEAVNAEVNSESFRKNVDFVIESVRLFGDFEDEDHHLIDENVGV